MTKRKGTQAGKDKARAANRDTSEGENFDMNVSDTSSVAPAPARSHAATTAAPEPHVAAAVSSLVLPQLG
jgi:hypothetical protein